MDQDIKNALADGMSDSMIDDFFDSMELSSSDKEEDEDVNGKTSTNWIELDKDTGSWDDDDLNGESAFGMSAAIEAVEARNRENTGAIDNSILTMSSKGSDIWGEDDLNGESAFGMSAAIEAVEARNGFKPGRLEDFADKLEHEEDTASKARNLAKNLFSADDDFEVVVGHRFKGEGTSQGSHTEVTAKVNAESLKQEVEKTVPADEVVTLTNMVSLSDLEACQNDTAEADDSKEIESAEKAKDEEAKVEEAKVEEDTAAAESADSIFDSLDVIDSLDSLFASPTKSADNIKIDIDEGSKSEDEMVKVDSDESEEKADEAAKSDDKTDDSDEVKEADEVEEADEDEDQNDDDEELIRLSERARMGRIVPENEVVVKEHVLHKDVHYSDAECEPDVPEVVVEKKKDFRVPILLIAILLSILVGMCFYLLVMKPEKMPVVNYAQTMVFQDGTAAYHAISSSQRGHFVAMCSDSRGLVKTEMATVSEFWPLEGGCRSLRISEDGRHVWYVDNNNDLFDVKLEKGTGFNPEKIASLTGMVEDRFDVKNTANGSSVSFVAKLEDGMSRVVRTIDLKTKQVVGDVALPATAMVCDGFTTDVYGYVSEGAMNIVRRDGSVEKASLDDAKLPCDSDQARFRCATDTDGEWAVLCNRSLHQGKGGKANGPLHMEDITAIRSGAQDYELIRSSKGTDYVSTNFLYQARGGSISDQIKFDRLGESFAAALIEKDNSVIALSDSKVVRIDSEGHVSDVVTIAADRVIGSDFVGDGSKIAAIVENGDAQSLVIWSLKNAAVVSTTPVKGKIQAMNIASNGVNGFMITNDGGKNSLLWMNWDAGTMSEAAPLKAEIADASWSDDSKYVLVRYMNNTWDLFEAEATGTQVRFVRSYPAGVSLAFARNGLLWRLENGALMNEQIGSGKISVEYSQMREKIAQAGATQIISHPRANYVMMWGSKGYVTLNVESMQARTSNTDKAISWTAPDRQGKFIATSAGIISLEDESMKPIPAALEGKQLSWTGSNHYMMTTDGQQMLKLDDGTVRSMIAKHHGIRMIGANSGFHPNSDYFTMNRDGAVSIEKIGVKGSLETVSVMASNNGSWCLATANGARVGDAGMCQTTKENVSRVMTQDAKVSEHIAAALVGSALPEFKPFEPKFVEDVKLAVMTVPDGAYLVFSPSEGELPNNLVFEDGMTNAPLNVQLKRDQRSFDIIVIGAGCEQRTVSFVPTSSEINLRIPLLLEGASGVGVKWYLQAGNEAVDMSEDTNIEFRSLVYDNVSSVRSCAEDDKVILSFANGAFAAPADADDAKKECLSAFVTSLNGKISSEKALPELSDVSSIRVEISLP